MRVRGLKKYAIGAAGMLALVMAVVLATGSGSAVAAQIVNVFVTNDASHPVPVHEQGTAQTQSADATQLVLDHRFAPGERQTVDVSAYREIRITVGDCSNGELNVAQIDPSPGPGSGSGGGALDNWTIDCSNANTATFEVPGTQLLLVWQSDIGPAEFLIYGRRN